jgi:glycosyltransferase involved in cell wall biosynthesis
MKICVVGPTYPYRGGIAYYTTLMVKYLREAGHATRFYSFTRQYPRWLFPGKTDRDPSAASSAIKVDCEYVLDPINPLTWWRLCRKIRADAPDVLVLQWWVPYWTPSLTFISRWIKRNTSIRIIYIVHNVVPHDGGGTLDRRLAMTVFRQGDGFVVHSEQDRHRLHALLPNSRIAQTRLPSYADTASMGGNVENRALREQLGILPDVPVLLFFGFVRPYKGLEYLIQALPRVLEQRKVHVLVVGEFWVGLEYYERYVREFGVENHITFVDRYVPNEEIGAYFGLANAVVLPFIAHTQSAVVQLAFGLHTPVITTRVGGLQEAVQDGVTGLLVPPMDDRALADAILRYFDEGLETPMRAAIAAQQVGGQFSWQELVRVLEGLISPR